MKLGFCHLGFWVCSVRHVWYVTKRPSKEEAAEGDQSPLEREAAIPAKWMGRAQPAGERGLFIVLLLWALVYNQKGGPLPKACLVATICSWGVVSIPNGSPFLARQAWVAQLTKPPASWYPILPGPTCIQVSVRKRTRLRNCLSPKLRDFL